MERELYDAIGDYLLAHIERHGHARTAEAFGVSRHTPWRFLERGQPGRALPRAVMAEAGDTPKKLAAATRALRGESRPAPLESSRGPHLTQALHETLRLVCEAPFASVENLSRMKRLPASSLRERLARLRRMGLAAAHPHRLAMLSDRPLRRYVPTAAGVAALSDDVLYRRPVSRQWLRLLAERLDGVALVYELAAMIADADPEQEPVRVEHCRSGPYDAFVTLSGGRTPGGDGALHEPWCSGPHHPPHPERHAFAVRRHHVAPGAAGLRLADSANADSWHGRCQRCARNGARHHRASEHIELSLPLLGERRLRGSGPTLSGRYWKRSQHRHGKVPLHGFLGQHRLIDRE